jgi:ABC-2 type transport system ATP-binding protein
LLLHELSPRRASLEEAYMSLTQDAVEYRSEPTTARRTTKKGKNR